MKVYRLDNIGLIDVAPPIAGFEDFIGVYAIKAEKVALVDVGPTVSLDNLFSGLRELGISTADISHILVTHIHLDHSGGLGEALKRMDDAVAVVHERGRPHLADPTRLWQSSQQVTGELALEYGQPEPVPQERMLIAKEGMTIDLGGVEIEVMLTPGHASHHLSFLEREGRKLFVGEVAGVYTADIDLVRPATPPPFDLEQTLASLDRLISVNPSTLCYSHFGCARPALDKLRRYRKRLILWGGIIAAHLEDEANWQGIFDRIKQKDEALVRLDRLPAAKRRREFLLIRDGIKGYIDYFQKHGTELIKGLK